MRYRRRTGLLACLFVVAAVLVGLVSAPSAAAATSTLRQTVDRTYQTNGRVAAVVVVGDTVYLGGNFTSVRPAGAAAGTGEVPRARLAAFSRSTGALLTWNPGANNNVSALAASPDGQTIYVGGIFSRVGGLPRTRLAAVSATTGAVTGFAPSADQRVWSIAATATRVYIGGAFTLVNGEARSRVAALTTTGALDPIWQASADNLVRSIALSPDGTSVYLGGAFAVVNGTRQPRLAKLSTADGAPQPLSSRPAFPLWSVVATADLVYVGGDGSGGHAAAYTPTGEQRWVLQTDGGVQALGLLDGVLYVGGHFDNVCDGVFTGPTTGFTCPDVLTQRRKILAVDALTGALDPWNPGANSNLGVFALATSLSKLHVGGDFTRLGRSSATGQPLSKAQQGYGQFSAA